jgi:translation initiation factor 1 (eIF-1/SUI1)
MLDSSEKHHIYKLAMAKWGKQLQIIVGMEETAELTQALSKYLRLLNVSEQQEGHEGKLVKAVDSIAEEISDVEIMLEQLKDMFECSNKVSEYKREKLLRLRERVKN